MNNMKTISTQKSFGGTLSVYDHDSATTGAVMRFAVFVPPQAETQACPVVTYLSGLTCTWENVMAKAGVQRAAAELGLIIVAPDTSPRGADVADDDAYDLGQGAGFYLTATQDPWAAHYKMDQYVTNELQSLVAEHFNIDQTRQGIFGHSMGGHGALTLHLKNPDLYQSCSAFSPIVAPAQVPWGQKAFSAYLGNDETSWGAYDATVLVEQSPSNAHILIDQGTADNFLKEQLKPELFEAACAAAGQACTIRHQDGYDHSYYFISSFIEDHLRHHADALQKC